MSIVLNAPGEIEIRFPLTGEEQAVVHCLEPVPIMGVQARYVTWDGARSMIGDKRGHLKVVRRSTPSHRGGTDRYIWEGSPDGWRLIFSYYGEFSAGAVRWGANEEVITPDA